MNPLARTRLNQESSTQKTEKLNTQISKRERREWWWWWQ